MMVWVCLCFIVEFLKLYILFFYILGKRKKERRCIFLVLAIFLLLELFLCLNNYSEEYIEGLCNLTAIICISLLLYRVWELLWVVVGFIGISILDILVSGFGSIPKFV